MATKKIREYVQELDEDLIRDEDSWLYVGKGTNENLYIPASKFIGEWSSTRTYSAGEVVVTVLGDLYKCLGTSLNDDPDDPLNSAYWTSASGSGSGAVIGNIYPDPTGASGNTDWTLSSLTLTSESVGLTGFDTELKFLTAGAGNAILEIDIPAQLRGELLELSFEGYLNTGTPAMTIYKQDGTTELPKSSTLPSSTGKFKLNTQFYTTSETSIKLKIIASGAIDLRMTNIYLGRPQEVYGGAISNLIAYTPTFTGFGTVGTVNIKYRRVGENIEIQGTVVVGTVTATEARMTLPSGLNTPSTVPTLSLVGMAGSNNAGDLYISTVLMEPSVQYLTFGYLNANPISKRNGNAIITSGATLSIDARLPIAEWSGGGTVQLASIGGNLYLSNSENVVNTNGVVGKSQYGVDGASILSNTSATYYDITLPRKLMPNEVAELQVRSVVDGNWVESEKAIFTYSGGYYILQGVPESGAMYGFGIQKTSADTIRVLFGAKSSNNFSGTAPTWANLTGSADGYDRWRVVIKNPNASIEIPPAVMAFYYGANSPLANVIIKPTTVVTDTHSAWSTSTGLFTAPMAGKYQLTVNFNQSNFPANFYVKKNGTQYPSATSYLTSTMQTASDQVSGSMVLVLATGDTVGLYCDVNATASASGNWMQITRIGA